MSLPAPLNGDDLHLLLAGLDSQSDAFLVFDRDRRFRLANRAAVALADLPLDEYVGRRITELADLSPYFADNRQFFEIVDLVFAEVMASGVGHSDDDAGRVGPDGESIPVSTRIHPIVVDGETIGLVWIIRDQMLTGSLMFRRAAVGMAHIDRNGNVREANDALLALTGRTTAELRDHPFVDLVDELDREKAASVLDPLLRREADDGRVEVRLLVRDSTSRWIDLSVARNGLGGPASGGICAVAQDITERMALQAELSNVEQELRRLALHDPLTGLPNRIKLADDLADAQRRAEDDGAHVAVLFIDFDGFKRVNDTSGHATGDRLLVEAGVRLRTILRPDDVAARLGGDEFVLCCAALDGDPDVARAQAEAIAERARDALQAPFDLDGTSWTLGASVGIALSRAGTVDPVELLRNADAEMYRTKGLR